MAPVRVLTLTSSIVYAQQHQGTILQCALTRGKC